MTESRTSSQPTDLLPSKSSPSRAHGPSDELDDAVFAPGERVAVAVPVPVRFGVQGGTYDYRVGDGEPLRVGDFVRITLGRRSMVGVVWGAGTSNLADGKIKPVLQKCDVPPMGAPLRRLVDFIAAYTLSPLGAVLKMAMSVPDALDPPPLAHGLVVATPHADASLRLTDARKRVLDIAQAHPRLSRAEMARKAGVSASVVAGLVKAGALAEVALQAEPVTPIQPNPRQSGPALSPAQTVAADDLRAKAQTGGFSVTLLDGVPGSGKTEVYFEAIAETLAQGRQVLVLLPEIALGSQWLSRFEARFGAPPAPWHSDLRGAQRRKIWRAVAHGQVPLVVGARSALFLPFADLGLIVVDEEHEAAFKQEEGVIYNARDMAVVRAREGAIPMVAVSATPSLETWQNAQSGRYDLLHLPERHAGAQLPDVAVIDMRQQKIPGGQWISPALADAVNETLAAGEQAMLFLNRRGYAPLTLCRTCGHRLQCPRCTAWLVEHKRTKGMLCHHCGYTAPLPKRCPSCDSDAGMTACGPGVERLAEEAVACFPDARIAMASSDSLAGPQAASELVGKIERNEVNLLVGTQIIAKGYHFPMLTLVGVVDADLGLSGGDLRASERTYQLLYQVAGRAGRAQHPGRVMLQTFQPDHPVIVAIKAHDRDQFISVEQDARRAAGMPPFGRLAALIVSSRDEADVDAACAQLARRAPHLAEVLVLGPAPAPLALLRGRYRRRFLIKAARTVALQTVLAQWISSVRMGASVRVQVDVDPYSFL